MDLPGKFDLTDSMAGRHMTASPTQFGTLNNIFSHSNMLFTLFLTPMPGRGTTKDENHPHPSPGSLSIALLLCNEPFNQTEEGLFISKYLKLYGYIAHFLKTPCKICDPYPVLLGCDKKRTRP